jgi:hypothetical protein
LCNSSGNEVDAVFVRACRSDATLPKDAVALHALPGDKDDAVSLRGEARKPNACERDSLSRTSPPSELPYGSDAAVAAACCQLRPPAPPSCCCCRCWVSQVSLHFHGHVPATCVEYGMITLWIHCPLLAETKQGKSGDCGVVIRFVSRYVHKSGSASTVQGASD